MAKPILKDFPDSFETERLTIRAPRPGDGKYVNEAILESLDELRPWMAWARTAPTLEESEFRNRNAWVKWHAREDLPVYLFLKGTDTFVGGSGLHRMNWDVPKFEIGYWCRTKFQGQGYITEAVVGLTDFAFEVLGARRVEIRTDEKNVNSWKIPERLGFKLEGTLINDALNPAGQLRDTRIYAKTR